MLGISIDKVAVGTIGCAYHRFYVRHPNVDVSGSLTAASGKSGGATSIQIATIDDATVSKLMEAAAAHARDRGKPMSIAVCDVGANLKGFLRMDGASLVGSKVCQDKAYTSAAARRPTHVNFERIKDDPPLLHGMVHQPRLIVFGGGYPVVIDGECVGAIGVSGGGHWTKDMDCALAALRAVGAKADWD